MSIELIDYHWYFCRRGQMAGPLSLTQLSEKYSSGQIDGSDSIWCDGFKGWEPAYKVLGSNGASGFSPIQQASDQGVTYTVVEGAAVKLSTIVWAVLGLIIPLWPISLPVCWYFAYRSYKTPSVHTTILRQVSDTPPQMPTAAPLGHPRV